MYTSSGMGPGWYVCGPESGETCRAVLIFTADRAALSC